jgi:hypothetical protein
LRLDWLARIFAKFFADVFLLLESQATGKSENDDINTGDLWWAWVDLNLPPSQSALAATVEVSSILFN